MATTTSVLPPSSFPRRRPSNRTKTGQSRDSNALRASVLETALELGLGGDTSLARWIFEDPLNEEEEEEEEEEDQQRQHQETEPSNFASGSAVTFDGSPSHNDRLPFSDRAFSNPEAIPFASAPFMPPPLIPTLSTSSIHGQASSSRFPRTDNTEDMGTPKIGVMTFPTAAPSSRPRKESSKKSKKDTYANGYESEGGQSHKSSKSVKKKDSIKTANSSFFSHDDDVGYQSSASTKSSKRARTKSAPKRSSPPAIPIPSTPSKSKGKNTTPPSSPKGTQSRGFFRMMSRKESREKVSGGDATDAVMSGRAAVPPMPMRRMQSQERLPIAEKFASRIPSPPTSVDSHGDAPYATEQRTPVQRNSAVPQGRNSPAMFASGRTSPPSAATSQGRTSPSVTSHSRSSPPLAMAHVRPTSPPTATAHTRPSPPSSIAHGSVDSHSHSQSHPPVVAARRPSPPGTTSYIRPSPPSSISHGSASSHHTQTSTKRASLDKKGESFKTYIPPRPWLERRPASPSSSMQYDGDGESFTTVGSVGTMRASPHQSSPGSPNDFVIVTPASSTTHLPSEMEWNTPKKSKSKVETVGPSPGKRSLKSFMKRGPPTPLNLSNGKSPKKGHAVVSNGNPRISSPMLNADPPIGFISAPNSAIHGKGFLQPQSPAPRRRSLLGVPPQPGQVTPRSASRSKSANGHEETHFDIPAPAPPPTGPLPLPPSQRGRVSPFPITPIKSASTPTPGGRYQALYPGQEAAGSRYQEFGSRDGHSNHPAADPWAEEDAVYPEEDPGALQGVLSRFSEVTDVDSEEYSSEDPGEDYSDDRSHYPPSELARSQVSLPFQDERYSKFSASAHSLPSLMDDEKSGEARNRFVQRVQEMYGERTSEERGQFKPPPVPQLPEEFRAMMKEREKGMNRF